jgi:hypothetical protein
VDAAIGGGCMTMTAANMATAVTKQKAIMPATSAVWRMASSPVDGVEAAVVQRTGAHDGFHGSSGRCRFAIARAYCSCSPSATGIMMCSQGVPAHMT